MVVIIATTFKVGILGPDRRLPGQRLPPLSPTPPTPRVSRRLRFGEVLSPPSVISIRRRHWPVLFMNEIQVAATLWTIWTSTMGFMIYVHDHRVARPCADPGIDLMKREDLADLAVFLAVAEAGTFTQAAIRLDVSQSAVSHTIRRLEASLGFRLLNRSTRNVSPTDMGDKLLTTLRPGLTQIEARIEELRSVKDTPSGPIRITTSKDVAKRTLWPVMTGLVRDYPEIQVEISTNSRLVDLAEGRFDAAIRLAESVGPDLIAVPVGPPQRMAAVGSPGYFAARGEPRHPSELADHDCITMRFGPDTAPYDWEFEKGGEEIVRKVRGPFIFNDGDLCVAAAREGYGITYVLLSEVQADIEAGLLRRVLSDWCPPFEGYALCYSSRRQMSAQLRLLVDRLRYRP